MPRSPDKPQKAVTAPSHAGEFQWPEIWHYASILFASLLVYFPAWRGSFIWDDAAHVTRPELQTYAGLGRIWFEVGATQQYYPLLHSAFWLEHRLWGDSVLGYHLFNILLHATAACLFGRLLRRLNVPGAWLAAWVFALHPVCVESVAWISEQKNTLSTVFYLATALAYLRFDDERRGRWYALASVRFLLALLTKTVTATLPAALLVIFWWRRGRLDWRRDVLPLLPWFVVGAASGLLTAKFERDLIGAQGTDFSMDTLHRCLLAGRVFWFYLGKLAWPANLIFNYPRWTVDTAQVWQWLLPLAAIILLIGLVLYRQQRRGSLAALLIFTGSLFPVLGFVNVYPFLFSFVADHFAYLASLAFFALTAAGLTLGLVRLPRWVSISAATTLLVALGGLTWRQSGMYRDAFALYETTLERNPASWLAHNNLAMALTDSGRVAEAIPYLEAALKIRPGFAEAENNLGDDLTRLHRPKEAVPHLQEALRLQPDYAEAHNNLGTAFIADGRPAESIPEFEEAVRLKPANAEMQNNLGIALSLAGPSAEALPHFEQAVKLKADFAAAELNWGLGLLLLDRNAVAVQHLEKAVSLDPNSFAAHKAYGKALGRTDRFKEAIEQYEKALRLKQDDAETHMNLALALRRLGLAQESKQHYLEAIRLNPAIISEK
jgi:tetratricopeptide (TPR) repeat protein